MAHQKLKHKNFAFRNLLLLVALSLILPITALPLPQSMAYIQPALATMAVATPEQNVRVIAQKLDTTDRAAAYAERLGGEVLLELDLLNAFVVEMDAEDALALGESGLIRQITIDGQFVVSAVPELPLRDDDECDDDTDKCYYEYSNNFRDTTDLNDLIGVFNVTGQGIGVAVIDSGVDDSHACLNVTAAPFGSGDEYGHGTHVAGIIACNGKNEYYKSEIDFRGMAPGVDLISLKVFDSGGMAYESDVVAAIEWIYNNKDAYNIRVVNMSFNSTYESSYHESYINAAAELLWFNGIVVVTSVGNDASYNTINTAPANDPFFIAVGASNENQSSQRDDDAFAEFSSIGTTMEGHFKPDVVAPGTDVISALSSSSSWVKMYPERVVTDTFFRLSGTSMAAPMVTGSVAVLLEQRPELTPDQVKYLIMNANEPISAEGTSVGYLNNYYVMKYAHQDDVSSANTGEMISQLLFTGDQEAWDSVAWNSVAWNSVAWNSVAWNSVAWNSVAWNSVAWNSVAWNSSVELDGIFWEGDR